MDRVRKFLSVSTRDTGMFRFRARHLAPAVIACVAVGVSLPTTASAQIVPGSGRRIERVFDDFESEDWSYEYRLPKSSREQDGRSRGPLAFSKNGMWIESAKRGTPDYVARIETPPGGLPGSKGAMMIRTLHSGIPGILTAEPQQDDLILGMGRKIGSLPASSGPSVVIRLWVPPYEEFDQRSGAHFGFRIALHTTTTTTTGRWIFKRTIEDKDAYWPGMFVQYMCKKDGYQKDSISIVLRGADNGGDFGGPELRPGWHTLGLSVTPDGDVHYYVRRGVGDLTAADKVASTTPYGYSASAMSTMFFNVTSRNDGATWSTPFVVDDPAVYRAY